MLVTFVCCRRYRDMMPDAAFATADTHDFSDITLLPTMAIRAAADYLIQQRGAPRVLKIQRAQICRMLMRRRDYARLMLLLS